MTDFKKALEGRTIKERFETSELGGIYEQTRRWLQRHSYTLVFLAVLLLWHSTDYPFWMGWLLAAALIALLRIEETLAALLRVLIEREQ